MYTKLLLELLGLRLVADERGDVEGAGAGVGEQLVKDGTSDIACVP